MNANYMRGACQYAKGLAEAARECRPVVQMNGQPWSWSNIIGNERDNAEREAQKMKAPSLPSPPSRWAAAVALAFSLMSAGNQAAALELTVGLGAQDSANDWNVQRPAKFELSQTLLVSTGGHAKLRVSALHISDFMNGELRGGGDYGSNFLLSSTESN